MTNDVVTSRFHYTSYSLVQCFANLVEPDVALHAQFADFKVHCLDATLEVRDLVARTNTLIRCQ